MPPSGESRRNYSTSMLFGQHAWSWQCMLIAHLQNCPLPRGDQGPQLTHGYLGPPHSTRQIPSRSSQPTLQGSCLIIPILYYGMPLPHPKIDHSMTIRTPSNTWLLWPTPPHMPNGISIGPAVFSGHLSVTGHTDRHKMQNNKSCLKCK